MTTGRPAAASAAWRRAARALRRLPDRTPLRLKLVGILLLLVAIALVGSGLAAAATLRGYLVARVDNQLEAAAHTTMEHGPGGHPGPDDGDGGGPLPSAFVVEVANPSGAPLYGPSSNLLDASEPLPKLPRLTIEEARGHNGHAFTVPATSGGTQWRVLAVAFPDGSGSVLVAQSLADVQSTVGRLELLELVVGVAAVVVIVGVGYVTVRASLRPLHAVEQTAAAIAGGDLTSRVPERDPRTEVGRLSVALNGMLRQIEAAFRVRAASEAEARRSEERMRRFVADASHELRTPLTSIRGFAELYRQAPGQADVERVMRRIEDEAARMGILVDDLLLLARLDQQRPLEQAPVDLLTIATDAVHDAQAVAPDRSVTLDVVNTDPPPVVVGDEARLRQVLGNLLGNALQHTAAGTPVTVRVDTCRADGDAGGGWATLEVADRGAGLAPDHAERVFERFYRADTSRSRDDGGSGLGLAIVAALVAGHGGRVSVDTAPGEGATFRVELPLANAVSARTPDR